MRGGSGGVPQRAAYSHLIFPQPNLGSSFFLGGWLSEPKDPPPQLLQTKSALTAMQSRNWNNAPVTPETRGMGYHAKAVGSSGRLRRGRGTQGGGQAEWPSEP